MELQAKAPGPAYSKEAVQACINQWNGRNGGKKRIGGKEARLIHALLKGRN